MEARYFGAVAVAVLCNTADASPGVGVMTDIGAPDGANASLVVRPVGPIALHGGVGTNYVSRGLRAGLVFEPFKSVVRPTLSVDYGRYEKGDANGLARMVSGDPTFSSAWLERIGYDYANAHLGLVIGGKRFAFFLQGGVSRITSELDVPVDEDSPITFNQRPMLTAWTPSARLGLIFYVKP